MKRKSEFVCSAIGLLILAAGLFAQQSSPGTAQGSSQPTQGGSAPPAQQEQSGAEQQPPQRVRVSQEIAQAFRVKFVPPKYPKEARKARVQGSVVLHVIISKDGDVTTVDLVSGHPILAPAAIDAVKLWKYKPYLLQGQPVEVDAQVTVNFTLSD